MITAATMYFRRRSRLAKDWSSDSRRPPSPLPVSHALPRLIRRSIGCDFPVAACSLERACHPFARGRHPVASPLHPVEVARQGEVSATACRIPPIGGLPRPADADPEERRARRRRQAAGVGARIPLPPLGVPCSVVRSCLRS